MDNRITIRVEDDMSAALQRFISKEGHHFRSKQDAYRFAIREWLTWRGYLDEQRIVPHGFPQPDQTSDRLCQKPLERR